MSKCFSLSQGAKIKMGKEDDAVVNFFSKPRKISAAVDHAHFAHDAVLFCK